MLHTEFCLCVIPIFRIFCTYQTFWTLAAIMVKNMKFSKFQHSSPIEMPFKHAIENWNLLHISKVLAFFRKIFRLCQPFWTLSAILVKKYICLSSTFRPIKIRFEQSIEHRILFHFPWVIATFWRFVYFPGHFEFWRPYWFEILNSFSTWFLAQSKYLPNKLLNVKICSIILEL